MGATQSQLEQLEAQSIFTQQELQRMLVRFRKLDTDGNGSLSIDEFMKDEDIKSNPLARRVISIFDQDNGGDVDFEEFVKVSNLHSSSCRTLVPLFLSVFIYFPRDSLSFPPRAARRRSCDSLLTSTILTRTTRFRMGSSFRFLSLPLQCTSGPLADTVFC